VFSLSPEVEIMKIISIVGARPEFVQAAPVSQELRTRYQEILVHTGQHYDYLMSQAFFDELRIPAPDYNLEVGSGTHGQQTGEILVRLEKVLIKENPDLVIVRGDTNSTLAGALAASKLRIPVAHIESGERSFDRTMPEEINRLIADDLSDILFCVSKNSIKNLEAEGIVKKVHWVGDVMLDAFLTNRVIASKKSKIVERLHLTSKNYSLVTIHRANNTDNESRLKNIVAILNGLNHQVVFPVHPRTRTALNNISACFESNVILIEPVSYFDMIVLEENALVIGTDSGGVQREAYFLKVPCVTLRDETEWVETVESGWNQLVGVDKDQAIRAWANIETPPEHPPIFGFGDASRRIADLIGQEFNC
jgi:UDP-GlcNAc3NAcA epimerase